MTSPQSLSSSQQRALLSNSASSSGSRAEAIAEQLVKERVFSAKPAQDALADLQMQSMRDGHARLAANGRAIDVSALPLGVLRAAALQDRVRNDVMIRRRVALQAESHIVQYVNAFVGAHSDAVDPGLDAGSLMSRVAVADQLHWLAANHLLVARRYDEQVWPSGNTCARIVLHRSAHTRHYPPSAALHLAPVLPQLPVNVAIKIQPDDAPSSQQQ